MKKWVSLFLFLVFIVSAVTGLVEFIRPHGRVAYWTDWHLFGLDKDQWDASHTIFGLLFIIFSIYHLFLNWKPMFQALKRPVIVVVTLLFTLYCFWGTVTYKAPFRYIIELEANIKNSWQTPAPPVPHAEMFTLQRVARNLGLRPKQAVVILENHGIKVSTPMESIKEIARNNHKNPAEIYDILSKEAGRPQGIDNKK